MRRMAAVYLCLAIPLLSIGCKRERRSPLAEAARACDDDGEMSCARPIFNVRSLAQSERYYRDVLGFKVDWHYGDPPDFGSVSRGHSVLFLAEGGQGTPGAWTMIFTVDVDRLHREYAAKQALIRMPPRTMPWGVREMHVSDLDGNVIRFGTGVDDDD
jgi:catechol 2,3-dioxygenase-like lactoylglutathione lyase family enzyme